MKYKLRCLLLCFLFIFSLQGCQKETKLEKPGNLITTTKNSSKENPNTEDPVETVPITGGTTADINSSTGDESNSEIAEKDGTVDNIALLTIIMLCISATIQNLLWHKRKEGAVYGSSYQKSNF